MDWYIRIGRNDCSACFRFKEAIIVFFYFLYFSTSLIGSNRGNTHCQPQTQRIGKLHPGSVFPIQQNIKTCKSIGFRFLIYIVGESNYSRIEFIEKLIIDILLFIRTVMFFCISMLRDAYFSANPCLPFWVGTLNKRLKLATSGKKRILVIDVYKRQGLCWNTENKRKRLWLLWSGNRRSNRFYQIRIYQSIGRT